MWGSLSHAGSSYTTTIDWFKEASGSDFVYSSNTQMRLKIDFYLFIPMFSPKANKIRFFISTT